MAAERTSFPATQVSLLEALQAGDAPARRAALDSLARGYWHPLHAYVRLRWRLDDDAAQDIVQQFFAEALERDLFARYDRTRARFRTFLRVCLDRFILNERKAASRQKRGGGSTAVSLDDVLATHDPALHADAQAEAMLDREWARVVFGEAVTRLRELCERRGKRMLFAVFARYDLEGPTLETPPSYASLAEEFDLPITQITNHLAWSRREFRRLVLEILQERSASDDDLRADALELLGIRLP